MIDIQAKKILEKKIADILISSLQNGAITVDDSRESSRFVLSKIDTLESDEDIHIFIQELSSRWPAYSPLLQDQKSQNLQKQDTEKLKAVQNKLQQFMKTT